MDFNLTTEQEMIRDMVRDFAEKNIKPTMRRNGSPPKI
jgi:alkylation response protein AidB-like acyl-CoA dehydrogenase